MSEPQCTYAETWQSPNGPMPMRCVLKFQHGPSRRTHALPGEKGPNSKVGEHYLSFDWTQAAPWIDPVVEALEVAERISRGARTVVTEAWALAGFPSHMDIDLGFATQEQVDAAELVRQRAREEGRPPPPGASLMSPP